MLLFSRDQLHVFSGIMSTGNELSPAELAQTIGPVVDGVILLFTVLATLAVVARIYTRVFIVKHVWADDIVILAALVRIFCRFG